MYLKLEQNFIKADVEWEIFRGDNLVSKFVSGNVTLLYYSLANAGKFRTIHERNPFGIPPERVTYTLLSGQGTLAPHRDHNTLVSLNYYISASEDVTSFFTSDSIPIKYEGKEHANVYLDAVLDKQGEFVANSNEAFLLDVSQIHSVVKTSTENRIFISYAWANHSFEEIAASLK